jgi:hypothetical protein
MQTKHHTPEGLAKIAAAKKAWWGKPKNRAAKIASLETTTAESWKVPEIRDARIKGIKAGARAAWADTEKRERIMAGHAIGLAKPSMSKEVRSKRTKERYEADPTPRILAKRAGLATYFTGVPCKYGHICGRATNNGNCLECREIHTQNRVRPKKTSRVRGSKERECVTCHRKLRADHRHFVPVEFKRNGVQIVTLSDQCRSCLRSTQ